MKKLGMIQLENISGEYNCFTGALKVAGGWLALIGGAVTLNPFAVAGGALVGFGNAVDMAQNGCMG
jgi:hypothetical protein